MPAPEFNSTAPSISDAINKLMANPEIISTVAAALGNMNAQGKASLTAEDTDKEDSPTVTDEGADEKSAQAGSHSDLGELVKSLTPVITTLKNTSHPSVQKNSEAARREALLCALKPYVSEGRREAIDYIIRISQVSDILKNIQR